MSSSYYSSSYYYHYYYYCSSSSRHDHRRLDNTCHSDAAQGKGYTRTDMRQLMAPSHASHA